MLKFWGIECRKSMEKKNKLWRIFKSTLYLSAFTFGGGYVILTLMKDTFVDKLKWIDKDQMLDMTAIAQSAPGAVAINASIVVGYETGGLLGMLVAILGTAIPPLVIISIISMFYQAFIANYYIARFLKGMQGAIAALIFKVSYDMGKDLLKSKSKFVPVIMVLAFILGYFLKVNIVYIIAGLILLGLLNALTKRRGHVS
ncbi:chromate transport protein [Anaerococcus tetradius ATCC 35098]|uniref:Chromate transport protein n=3 Tax=Anaerococcus tetradius TaxID=33036 RepID=C2CHR6_9FIRM|nr:chromate transport protein [Anaerococcus tetradius ATCC 35098]KWZ78560.1 chromate transport protein [Anaerococcus tetradius]